MSERELAPCPFCGGKANVTVEASGKFHRVECSACPVDMAGADKDEAIAAWNRRAMNNPVDQPKVSELDALAETIRIAVLSCGHTITGDEITLRRSERKEGNALRQLSDRILASLPRPQATTVGVKRNPEEAMG